MKHKFRQFVKYDRIFLVVSVIFLILLGIFLYYLANTRQPDCDYYYLHTAKLLYPFVMAVATILTSYTFVKLRKSETAGATNGQLFGIILGLGGIILAASLLYIIVGFGLFFGKTC